MTDLSLIIVSYNTKDLLAQCLNAARKSLSGLKGDIIVVDNASRDGSPEMIREEFPDVTLLCNTENAGFARAVNQGIRSAGGRYVLLLNSDSLTNECTIRELVRFMDEHPLAAASGPKVLDERGHIRNKGYFFPSITFSLIVLSGVNLLMSEERKKRWFPRFYWSEDETREVDYLEGSCFLMRREVLESVGLLSEDFFLYYEEQEWCRHAKKKGFQIWYVPSASVIHLGSASPSENRDALFEKSRVIYYRRNIGILKGSILSVLTLTAGIVNLCRVLFYPSKRQETSIIRKQLKLEMQFFTRFIVS